MIPDASLFDRSSISDETTDMRDMIAAQLSSMREPDEVASAAEWREQWVPQQPYVSSSAFDDEIVQSDGSSIPIRVYPVDDPRGVYLHLHWGGFVLGAPWHFDLRNEMYAAQTQLTVVSVNYRLAPEHRWPAAADDAMAAAEWLLDGGTERFGTPNELLIGGESAGATLAVATMLRLRDEHSLQPFLGAVLNYGGYDLRRTYSKSTAAGGPILTLSRYEWCTDQMLGTDRPPGAVRGPAPVACASRPDGARSSDIHRGYPGPLPRREHDDGGTLACCWEWR